MFFEQCPHLFFIRVAVCYWPADVGTASRIWIDSAVMLPSELALPITVTFPPCVKSLSVPAADFVTEVELENRTILELPLEFPPRSSRVKLPLSLEIIWPLSGTLPLPNEPPFLPLPVPEEFLNCPNCPLCAPLGWLFCDEPYFIPP
jgi:hypothetical protein